MRAPERKVRVPGLIVFIVGQLCMGVLLSFVVPLAFFAILFIATPTFTLFSTQLLTTLFISPMLSAVLSPMFVPIGFHKSAKKLRIRPIVMSKMQKLPAIFGPGRSLIRHMLFGVLQSALILPIGMACATALAPMTLAIFSLVMATYIALNTLCVLPVASVMLCVSENVKHSEQLLARRPIALQLPRCLRC